MVSPFLFTTFFLEKFLNSIKQTMCGQGLFKSMYNIFLPIADEHSIRARDLPGSCFHKVSG